MGGFKALHPLKVSAALEGKIGRGFQATVRSDGQLKVVCSGQMLRILLRTVRKGVRAQTHNAGEQGLLNKRENTRNEHNKRENKLVGYPSGRPPLW